VLTDPFRSNRERRVIKLKFSQVCSLYRVGTRGIDFLEQLCSSLDQDRNSWTWNLFTYFGRQPYQSCNIGVGKHW